jgi:hypothetical protein
MSHRLATTFDEMVDILATEDSIALVLSWWCRVEKALAYYTIAYHGMRTRTAAEAIGVLDADARVDQTVIERLHALRRKRNAIAHGEIVSVSPEYAKAFASEALELGWIVGCTVPNDLALSSGAALAA